MFKQIQQTFCTNRLCLSAFCCYFSSSSFYATDKISSSDIDDIFVKLVAGRVEWRRMEKGWVERQAKVRESKRIETRCELDDLSFLLRMMVDIVFQSSNHRSKRKRTTRLAVYTVLDLVQFLISNLFEYRLLG